MLESVVVGVGKTVERECMMSYFAELKTKCVSYDGYLSVIVEKGV